MVSTSSAVALTSRSGCVGPTASAYCSPAITTSRAHVIACDGIQVWELVGGTCTQMLQGHTGGVTGATLCGVRLVSSSIDKSVIVWDMESGLPAKRLLGHTASVNCVASIRDDRVVSGGDDNLLLVRSRSSVHA